MLLQSTGAPEALLVLDQIQKINNWSTTIKKNWELDTRNKLEIKVILLVSAQMLLQKGLTESLAGRFEVIPVTTGSLKKWQLLLALLQNNMRGLAAIPARLHLCMMSYAGKIM